MSHIENSAAELALGLRLGIVTKEDVIAWALNSIAKLDAPPMALIDLTYKQKADQDILDGLSQLSSGVGLLDVFPRVMEKVGEVLRHNPARLDSISDGLYQLYVDLDYEVPAKFAAIGHFADAVSLADEGTHSTRKQVLQDLLEFADSFKEG